MDKIYYIYHIPTYTRKNGKIGKIGCTEEVDAKVRVEKQGYTDYEILETHTDIIIASNRERELQKQYGYPVDSVLYYIAADKKKGRKGGIKTQKKYNNGPINGLGCVKKFGKQVYQYDLDGNFIKQYPSRNFVIRNLKIQIHHCLAGRATQAGGFVWKYKEE